MVPVLLGLLLIPPPRTVDSLDLPSRYRSRIVLVQPKKFNEKVIALTFDDGPDPKVTPWILKTLRKYDAKATFFILGVNAHAHPATVKQIAAAGHAIGQHSWSHASKADDAKASLEFSKTNGLLKTLLGYRPIMYRPPYGITKNGLTKLALKERDAVIIWTRIANDTSTKSPAKVNLNVGSPGPGEIVLMHDGYGKTWTAEALPRILKRMTAKGYKFITVPDMLRRWDRYLDIHPDRGATKPWHL